MSRTTLRCVLVAIVALAWAAPQVRAQDDEPFDRAGPMALPVTNRTVEMCRRTLGFDAEQASAARSLYQGYRSAFGQATAKAHKGEKELMEKAQKSGDWGATAKERGQVAMDYVEEVLKLEKGLMDDLRALCTPAQGERFASVERARRRETGLLLALGIGERVDLVSMLETMKIDRAANPAVGELVQQWEMDVDRLLVEKEKMVRTGMKALIGREGQEDAKKDIGKFFSELSTLGGKVGETSRRAAREVQALLPEDKREAFDREIKLRCFPRIYGRSDVTSALKTAEAMKDVTAEEKTRLAEIRESYERDAQGVNARWASASEEKQRQMRDKFIEMMEMGREQEDPADPFTAARADRRALDDRYLAKIKEVLTAEQREKLPEPTPSHGRGGVPEFLPDFEADFKSAWDGWKKDE